MDGQGAAEGKGEDGEAGGGSGEKQLVVQIVKHNRLKDEVGIKWVISCHLDDDEHPGETDSNEEATGDGESERGEAEAEENS